MLITVIVLTVLALAVYVFLSLPVGQMTEEELDLLTLDEIEDL